MDSPYRTAEARAPDGARACLFCAGPIDAATTTCTACGAMAGPAADARPSRGCPRCALALEPTPLADAPSWRCPRCHGVFVPHVAWDAVVTTVREGRAIDLAAFVPPPPRETPTPTALLPSVACVACGGAMDRARFGAISETVVDVCERHGLWLDAAELGAVLAFARRVWEAGGQLPIPPDELRQQRALLVYLADRGRVEAKLWKFVTFEDRERAIEGLHRPPDED